MPFVTVIIACLNDVRHLPRAVQSVLDQTYVDIELVIMDGGSRDGTLDYLRSLQDRRIIWRSEADGGIAQAWNKAVALARGRWLIFLGADDFLWNDEVIEKAAPILENHGDVAFAFGEVQVVARDSDQVVQSVKFDRESLVTHLRGPAGLGLPHQGFLHNRRTFKTGLFDVSFRMAADYEFISRFSDKEENFFFLPIGPIAAFRMGGLSTDTWVSVEARGELKRAYRMRGRPRLHGTWALTKAHMKNSLRKLLGAEIARRLVNFSRLARGLPLYHK